MSVGAASTRLRAFGLGIVLTAVTAASVAFAHVSADRLRDLQTALVARLDAKPSRALKRAAQHVETAAAATRHHRKVTALARAGRLVRALPLSEVETSATNAAFSAFHDELAVARAALADRIELSGRPARAIRRLRRRLDAADRALERAVDADAESEVPTKRRWRSLTSASRLLRSQSNELSSTGAFDGVVGRDGGLAESGGFSLLVPPRELTTPITFDATTIEPEDLPYAPPAGAFAAFELSPTGVEFARRVPFTVPLPSARAPGTAVDLLAYEQQELGYVVHADARVNADGVSATGYLWSTLGPPAGSDGGVTRWVIQPSVVCSIQVEVGSESCHLYAREAGSTTSHVHVDGMETQSRNAGPHTAAIPSAERDSRLQDLRRALTTSTRRVQLNVYELSTLSGATIYVKNDEEHEHPASADDDFFMSPRCADRLLRLATLVETRCGPEWHVRVTEAYDGRGEHAANSLHYEGRAVDLTLTHTGHAIKTCESLVVLADLAAEAGFDYVRVERPTADTAYVHAAVRDCDIATLFESESAATLGFGGAGGLISEDCFNCDPAWRRVTFSDFALSNETELFSVRWEGFYENFSEELNPAAPSTAEWEISVWSSKDMEPDELLATWTRSTDAVTRTPLGTAMSPAWNAPSIVPIYAFEMTLAPSFVAEPSRTYWLSIVAKTDAFAVPPGAEFATTFLWSPAGGDDDVSVFEDEMGERVDYRGRRAFALLGCE